jgi:hypothetical protein
LDIYAQLLQNNNFPGCKRGKISILLASMPALWRSGGGGLFKIDMSR